MKHNNRLINESSAYLRQHADNPVDWYAWGDEATAKAKHEQKPILLSIGYSACHWCHVMAQESFSDIETAQLMNRWYVNIKVDREERPDIDKIYQTAHQILTGQGGGWPLTAFLDPHTHIPFYVGTYFPIDARYGCPAFKEVLKQLADFYQLHKQKLEKHNMQLHQRLLQANQSTKAHGDEINPIPLSQAYKDIASHFDIHNGGLIGAPKFPHPSQLERLLRHAYFLQEQGEDNQAAMMMVNLTLTKMANGGIYDQLGGGFFRYAVDDAWQIPHFEKMLYDNGQLMCLYAQMFVINHEPLYAQILNQTAYFTLRELRSPQGGFYATLDADSEHVEGKYYYWDRNEIKNILSEDEFKISELYFGLDALPNFERHWHLHLKNSANTIAQKLAQDEKKIQEKVQVMIEKLFNVRKQRVYPNRDEKIITAWNALMIKGFALAGLAIKRQDFILAAQQALDFIQANLWHDGKLYATYQNKRGCLAYLDDYAFLLDAVITLLQIQWRDYDLEFAIALAEILLIKFEDKENGGFYFTANDHEQLIMRPKSFADEAIPSGNGIAAIALSRLGHLLGERRYLQACQKTLQGSWRFLKEFPSAHASLLTALEEYLYPAQLIILRIDHADGEKWIKAYHQQFQPRRLAFAIPATTQKLPGFLAQCKSRADRVVAYICTGSQCQAPIEDLDEFKKILLKEIHS